jgi:deazaflavin-dependent oxidoreductase (nitroreductase family)
MSSIPIFFKVWARTSKYAPYRLHSWLYKLTGGKFGADYPGIKLKVLLLTTTGRKSGLQRTHPVMYYRDGENFVIAASNAGADKPPLWYLNLRKRPEATVQVQSVTQRVVAREANAEERTRLWAILKELHPIFAAYEKFTERQMPVIILRPIQPSE